jgi:hypothetical protein
MYDRAGKGFSNSAEKQVGSLVDGGYFENEGLQTALDLAEWLAAQSTPDRPVLPIIVQATGDGEADVTRTEVMTCDNASDGRSSPTTSTARCKYLPHSSGSTMSAADTRRYFYGRRMISSAARALASCISICRRTKGARFR